MSPAKSIPRVRIICSRANVSSQIIDATCRRRSSHQINAKASATTDHGPCHVAMADRRIYYSRYPMSMRQIKHPSFFIALVLPPFVVIVVIVLFSVDAGVCVAAKSSGSVRDGSFGFGAGIASSSPSSPPSLTHRKNIASRNLRRDTLSFLQFLSSSLSINNNSNGDDGDDDALLFHQYYSKPPHDRRLYEILGVSSMQH